jgi:O-antigen/teichoic acid export membrane protein
LLTPVYVALLGVESYGLIGFYGSWIAILGILDTGISATAVRETAWLSARGGESDRIPSLIRTLEVAYWAIIVVLGLLLLVASWSFGGEWFHAANIGPRVIRDALMLMVASLVVQVPSGLYIGGLMGLQRQVECSALVALFGTVRGAGAVAALLLFGRDVRIFFAWQIVASVLQTSVMRWSLLRRVHSEFPARFSLERLQAVRQFAGQTSLVTALGLVLAQMDKLILSRLVTLQVFGLYMLAWTVASGLSRVATPLLQAFSPRFTELVSKGNDEGLRRQVRVACQLTNALVLPPALLLVFLAHPVLRTWTRNEVVAAGAAPLLTVLTIGTLLSACSYPAASVLYSRNRLRGVIRVNLVAVVVLLPMLIIGATNFGAMGAAVCWVLYGLFAYVAYQNLGLEGLPDAQPLSAVVRDFAAPAMAALVTTVIAWQLAQIANGTGAFVAVLGAGLIAGWAAALVSCQELFRIATTTMRWNSIATHWSA